MRATPIGKKKASAAEETASVSKEGAVKMEAGDAKSREEEDAVVEASKTDEDTDEEMTVEIRSR